MRQLDLFGSFFEPTPGDQPAENLVATKKEEKYINDDRWPSYSKNLLRSEQVMKEVIENTEVSVSVQNGEEALLTTPIQPTIYPTLFDIPVAFHAEGEVDNITLTTDPSMETQDAHGESEIISEEEIPKAVIIENSLFAVAISQRTTDEFVLATLVEEKKKISSLKPKTPGLPELQRNGAVVFDDGKITVKIKNKSPFPAPLVREKVERVKKEKIKKIPQKRGRKSFKEIDAEVDLIEIPEDDLLFKKQYYGISEVAKWFRVNTSLLRYWENEFDVLKPRKNRKGDRLFRPEDVKNLQLIYQLLRQKKYTIEGAKEYIKTNKRKADIQLQLTNTLQKFKSFLLDLKANLEA